ncbi:DUF2336 domain-containing protein [Breoghania sp.]|uniref:DUF2336 domain-containing protein n=1 Tax=Breoghania sp. TaxID=2065378 RepID=UPI002AA7D0B3|nr:DUF2336 domain-containing protein [Breoghania sp.]
MTGYTTPKGVGSLVQADESTRKAHLLLAATELFVASDAPSRVERHVYAELFRQYITATPVKERRKVATLLSRCGFAPHDCVLALAQDEDVSVAHRVLAYSTVLHDCDLIAAVGRGPQSVRRAISLRRTLSDDVLSALGRYTSDGEDFVELDDEDEAAPVLEAEELDIGPQFETPVPEESTDTLALIDDGEAAEAAEAIDVVEEIAAPEQTGESELIGESEEFVEFAEFEEIGTPEELKLPESVDANEAMEAAELPQEAAISDEAEAADTAERAVDISHDAAFADLPAQADDVLAELRALARKTPLPEQPPVPWSDAGIMAGREKRSDFEFVGEDTSLDEADALAQSVEAMTAASDPAAHEESDAPAAAPDQAAETGEEAWSEDARAEELSQELADGLADQLADVSLGLRIEADLEPMEQLRRYVEEKPARAAFGQRRTPPPSREDAPGAIPLAQRTRAIRKLKLSSRGKVSDEAVASVAASFSRREPGMDAAPEKGPLPNPIKVAPRPEPVVAPAEHAVPEGATLAPREARMSPTPGFNAETARPVVTSPTRPRAERPRASAELRAFLEATPKKRRRFIIKAQAEVLAETVARRGRLRDKIDAELVSCVEKTTAANDMETLRGLLTYAFNLPPETIDRMLADPHGEPLMIMAAAIGVPTSRTVNMALLISPAAYSLERVRELSALRANLDIRVARHMVASWTKQPPQKAVHAPILEDAMRTRRQAIHAKANPSADTARENTLDDDGVLVLRKVV